MVRPMQITNAADRLADRLESKARRSWNPDLHPRDSKGRFVETGGIARLWGGGMARVLRALGGRNVLVENLSTHERSTINASRLTMVSRPDGSAPTRSKRKVRDEDERRQTDGRRGTGYDADDAGDHGDTPDEPHDQDDQGNAIGEDRDGEDHGAGPEPEDDEPEDDATPKPSRRRDPNRRFKTLDDVRAHWASGKLRRHNKDSERQDSHNKRMAGFMDELGKPQLSRNGHFVIGQMEINGKTVWGVTHSDTGVRFTTTDRKAEALDFASRMENVRLDGKPLDWNSPDAFDRINTPEGRKLAGQVAAESRKAFAERAAKKRASATSRTKPAAPTTPEQHAAQQIAGRTGAPEGNIAVGHVGAPRAAAGDERGRPRTDAELREFWKRGGAHAGARKEHRKSQADALRRMANDPNLRIYLADHRGFAIVEDTSRDDDYRFTVLTSGAGRRLSGLGPRRLMSYGNFADRDTADRFALYLGSNLRHEDGRTVDWGDPNVAAELNRFRDEDGQDSHRAIWKLAGQFDRERGVSDSPAARFGRPADERDEEQRQNPQTAPKTPSSGIPGEDETPQPADGPPRDEQEEQNRGERLQGAGEGVLADVPAGGAGGTGGDDAAGDVLHADGGGDRGADRGQAGRLPGGDGAGGGLPGGDRGDQHGDDEGQGSRPARAGVQPGEGAGHGGQGDAEGEPAEDRSRVAFGSDDEERRAPQYQPPKDGRSLVPNSVLARVKANIAAIEVLRRLQDENRPATAAEQETLARWSGWGATPQVFVDSPKPEFVPLQDRLRELLSEAEWDAAKENTLNAHYTDPSIIREVWKAVEELGFDGGNVLEPGSGSGNFIGYAPESADMLGVELDPITAGISKALYPHANIRNEGFERTRAADGTFDMTVGNVPFGDYQVVDLRHNKGGHNIHNHFILKSLDLTRPGGLVAVVTSRYTMDGSTPRAEDARMEMARKADLVGAVRLPTGAHRRTAGTDVVTDLLIFRRREKDKEYTSGRLRNGQIKEPSQRKKDDPPLWVHSARVTDLPGQDPEEADKPDAPKVHVNPYFLANPNNVLGHLAVGHGMYGPGELRVDGDGNLDASLSKALKKVVARAKDAGLAYTPDDGERRRPEMLPEGSDRIDGHVQVSPDGTFTQVRDGMVVPFDVPRTQVEEATQLLGLRDSMKALIAEESRPDADEALIETLRGDLKSRYDAYHAKFGALNRFDWATRKAIDPETGQQVEKAFRKRPQMGGLITKDPTMSVVLSLDTYDGTTGTSSPAAIFSKRQSRHRTIADRASSPEDAMAIVMEQKGTLDTNTLAQVMGVSPQLAREKLLAARSTDPETGHEWPLVFEPHNGGDLIPAADYLSGNVRKRLEEAQALAAEDSRFDINVQQLEAVLPPDITPGEIDAPMGASWLGGDVVQAFLRDKLNTSGVRVSYQGGSLWKVDAPDAVKKGRAATRVWGTDDFPALKLAEAILTNGRIRVTYRDEDGKTYVDEDATAAAQTKAEELKEEFQDWLWRTPERSEQIKKLYNDTHNNLALRSYDGQRRTMPGLAEWFKPHAHQHSAVARMVNEPAVLLAHEVGAGKTAEMTMGVMELRRLGLINKAAIVVPNHMLQQFHDEFAELYPESAAKGRILSASSEDLQGRKRREFIARVATGDYDAVILTQNAFESIPMRPEVQLDYVKREKEHLETALRRQKEQDALNNPGVSRDSRMVKEIQNRLKKLEAKITAKVESSKDTAGLYFEDTGIDYVVVDEAHHYKNLATNSGIPGAAIEGSNRASDLDMKLEYLRKNTKSGRVVTFATATPISNSVTEAHTMLRYLRPDLLEAARVRDFDEFASTYGKIVSGVELAADGSGFKEVSRFAAFRNMPELLRIWKTVADVKTSEDLAEYLDTPDISGGKAITVSVEPTEQMLAYQAELASRARAVKRGDVDPREDNMLKISSDGRKVSLDPRMVGLDEQGNKLPRAAENIARIYEKTKNAVYPTSKNDPTPHETPGGLQIVFLDMGTPKDPGKGKKKGKKNDGPSSVEELADSPFPAYQELKELLISQGVPAEKIRFIHEAKNDAEKARLFADARNGKIAVLVGSTSKMGTGTNVQLRATALHHLDCPWRPADLEQRNGRIIRQGNANPEVAIFQYVTEQSFDGFSWQTVARKAKFIRQLMKGNLTDRTVEDIPDGVFNAEQVTAISTGNPYLLEQANVKASLAVLKRKLKGHQRTIEGYKSTIHATERLREDTAKLVAQLKDVIGRRKNTRGDNFNATIGTSEFTKRDEAAKALSTAAQAVLRQGQKDPYRSGGHPKVVIGRVGNIEVTAQYRTAWGDYGRIHLVDVSFPDIPRSRHSYQEEDLKKDSTLPVTRLEDSLADVDKVIVRAESRLRQEERAAETARERVDRPFEQADELEAAERRGKLIGALIREQGKQTTSEEAGREKRSRLESLEHQLREARIAAGEDSGDVDDPASAQDTDLLPRTPAPPSITTDAKGRPRVTWPDAEAKKAAKEREKKAKVQRAREERGETTLDPEQVRSTLNSLNDDDPDSSSGDDDVAKPTPEGTEAPESTPEETDAAEPEETTTLDPAAVRSELASIAPENEDQDDTEGKEGTEDAAAPAGDDAEPTAPAPEPADEPTDTQPASTPEDENTGGNGSARPDTPAGDGARFQPGDRVTYWYQAAGREHRKLGTVVETTDDGVVVDGPAGRETLPFEQVDPAPGIQHTRERQPAPSGAGNERQADNDVPAVGEQLLADEKVERKPAPERTPAPPRASDDTGTSAAKPFADDREWRIALGPVDVAETRLNVAATSTWGTGERVPGSIPLIRSAVMDAVAAQEDGDYDATEQRLRDARESAATLLDTLEDSERGEMDAPINILLAAIDNYLPRHRATREQRDRQDGQARQLDDVARAQFERESRERRAATQTPASSPSDGPGDGGDGQDAAPAPSGDVTGMDSTAVDAGTGADTEVASADSVNQVGGAGRYLSPAELVERQGPFGNLRSQDEKDLFGPDPKERIGHLASQTTQVSLGDTYAAQTWYGDRYVGFIRRAGKSGTWEAHLPFTGHARAWPRFSKRQTALAYLALASDAQGNYNDLTRISPDQQASFQRLDIDRDGRYDDFSVDYGGDGQARLNALRELVGELQDGRTPSGNVADDLGHVIDSAAWLYAHAPHPDRPDDLLQDKLGDLIRWSSEFLDTLRPGDRRAGRHDLQRNQDAAAYLRDHTTAEAKASADTVAPDALRHGDLVELSGHVEQRYRPERRKAQGYLIGEPIRAMVDVGRKEPVSGWRITISSEPFGAPSGIRSRRLTFLIPDKNKGIVRFVRAKDTGLPTDQVIHRKGLGETAGQATDPEPESTAGLPDESTVINPDEARIGDYIRAKTQNTAGNAEMREGYLLAEPKRVTASRDRQRIKAWRLYLGQPGESHSPRNAVTILADEQIERLNPPEKDQDAGAPEPMPTNTLGWRGPDETRERTGEHDGKPVEVGELHVHGGEAARAVYLDGERIGRLEDARGMWRAIHDRHGHVGDGMFSGHGDPWQSGSYEEPDATAEAAAALAAADQDGHGVSDVPGWTGRPVSQDEAETLIASHLDPRTRHRFDISDGKRGIVGVRVDSNYAGRIRGGEDGWRLLDDGGEPHGVLYPTPEAAGQALMAESGLLNVRPSPDFHFPLHPWDSTDEEIDNWIAASEEWLRADAPKLPENASTPVWVRRNLDKLKEHREARRERAREAAEETDTREPSDSSDREDGSRNVRRRNDHDRDGDGGEPPTGGPTTPDEDGDRDRHADNEEDTAGDGDEPEADDAEDGERRNRRRRRRNRDRDRPGNGVDGPGGAGLPNLPNLPDLDNDRSDDADGSDGTDRPGLEELKDRYRSGSVPTPKGADSEEHAAFLRRLADNDTLALSPEGSLIVWSDDKGRMWQVGHAASGMHLPRFGAYGEEIGGRDGAVRLAGEYERMRGENGQPIDWAQPQLDVEALRQWRDSRGEPLTDAVTFVRNSVIRERQREEGRRQADTGTADSGEQSPSNTDETAGQSEAASHATSEAQAGGRPVSPAEEADDSTAGAGGAGTAGTAVPAESEKRAGDGAPEGDPELDIRPFMSDTGDAWKDRIVTDEAAIRRFGSLERMRELASRAALPSPQLPTDRESEVWLDGRLVGSVTDLDSYNRTLYPESYEGMWQAEPEFFPTFHEPVFRSREAAIAEVVLRALKAGPPDQSQVTDEMAEDFKRWRDIHFPKSVDDQGFNDEERERYEALDKLLTELAAGRTPSGNLPADLGHAVDELGWLADRYRKGKDEDSHINPSVLARDFAKTLDHVRPEDPRAAHHRELQYRAAIQAIRDLNTDDVLAHSELVPVTDLRDGDVVIKLEGQRATGSTGRRTGYLRGAPKKVTLRRGGQKIRAYRVRVGDTPWEDGGREEKLTVPIDAMVYRRAGIDQVEIREDQQDYGLRVGQEAPAHVYNPETDGIDYAGRARAQASQADALRTAGGDDHTGTGGTAANADRMPSEPESSTDTPEPAPDADEDASAPKTPAPAPQRRPVDEPTTANEPAPEPDREPEPVGGRPAEWVKIHDLSHGDLVRVDGTTKRGTPRTLAGYVVDGPKQIPTTRAHRTQAMYRVLIADDPDGKGSPVWVMPDAAVARATRDDTDQFEGAPQTGADADVLAGRISDTVPTDRDGNGIFPGSVVTDGNGNDGVVTGASANSVRAQFGDSRSEEDYSPTSLHVTDGGAARPSGWTADGHRVRPGNVVGDQDGTRLGTVEEVDGDTVTVATPNGMAEHPAGDLRVIGDTADSESGHKVATIEPADTDDVEEGDVIVRDTPQGPRTARVTSRHDDGEQTDFELEDTTTGESGNVSVPNDDTVLRARDADGNAPALGPDDAAPDDEEITSHEPAPAVDPVTGPTVDPQLSPEERDAIADRGRSATSHPDAEQGAARIANDLPLTPAQATALADDLRAGADTDTADGRAALRAARQLEAAAGPFVGSDEPLDIAAEDELPHPGTVGAVGVGDTIALPDEFTPDTMTTYRVVDVHNGPGGVRTLTVEDGDGQRFKRTLASSDALYQLPEPKAPAADPAPEPREPNPAPDPERLRSDYRDSVVRGVIDNALQGTTTPGSIHQLREQIAQKLTPEALRTPMRRARNGALSSITDAGIDGDEKEALIRSLREDAISSRRDAVRAALRTLNDFEPRDGESEDDMARRTADALRLIPEALRNRPAADDDSDGAPHVNDAVNRHVDDAVGEALQAAADGAPLTEEQRAAIVAQLAARMAANRDATARQIAARTPAGQRPGVLAHIVAGLVLIARKVIALVKALLKALAAAWTRSREGLRRTRERLARFRRGLAQRIKTWPETRRLRRLAAATSLPGHADGLPLADRVAHWARLLPAPGRFGQVSRRSRWYRPASRITLAGGQLPPVQDGVRWTMDRAADGGPGPQALRHIAALRAAGRDVDTDVAARLAATAPELGDDPHGSVRHAARYADSAEQRLRDLEAAAAGGVPDADLEVAAARVEAQSARQEAARLQQAYAAALPDAVLGTLSEVREMGPGTTATLVTTPNSDPDAVRALTDAARYIPRDWLTPTDARLIGARSGDTGAYDPRTATATIADLGDAGRRAAAYALLAHLQQHAPDLVAAAEGFHFTRTHSGRVGARRRTSLDQLLAWLFRDRTAQGDDRDLVPLGLATLFSGDWYEDDDLRAFLLGLLATR